MVSDLTVEAVATLLEPFALLANAPKLTDQLCEAIGALLMSEGVTCAELDRAAFELLKTEKFWPAPATILEHIREARKAQGQARTAEELEQQREARTLRLASPQFRGRYGRPIEIAQDYVPPSLRALTQEPDDSQRGNGPRRMI